MRSIKSYAREAYKNRYAFDHVSVSETGVIKGHWNSRNGTKLDPVDLGNIADCSSNVNDRKTGIQFYNRHNLVYTFENK